MITRIPADCFKGCVGLQNIMLPDTLMKLGDHAFANCSLKTITVPSAVISIGKQAIESDTIVYGDADSYVQNWCGENGTVFCASGTILPNELFVASELVVECGERMKLEITAEPSDADLSRSSIASTNATVAQVDQSGMIYAIACGDTDVYARDPSGAFAICRVMVVDHQYEKIDAVEDTCTADGNVEYYVCSFCGRFFIKSENDYIEIAENDWILPTKGHMVVDDAAIEATCARDGLTAGQHCERCGEVIMEQQVIAKTSTHHYLDGVCRDCRCSFDTDNMETLVIPASLRSIEEEAFSGIAAQVIIVPSSCENIGSRAFENCKYLEFVYIPAKLDGQIPDDAFEGCDNLQIIYRLGE